MSGAIGALRSRASRAASLAWLGGPALSLGLKLGGSALNLLMLTAVARSLEPRDFGIFALWFNAVAFLAVVAGCGQEKLIMRSWAEYRSASDLGLARGSLAFGWAATAAGALALALAVGAAALAAGTGPGLAAAAAALLVLQTAFIFASHVNRAVLGIFVADVHEMTWRLVVITAVGAAWLVGRTTTSLEVIVFAAAGSAVALAFQVLASRRHLRTLLAPVPRRMERRIWAARSWRMALGGVLEAASQFLEVIVIGAALSPAVAGGYFVASRLANMFAMIPSGLNTYASRQISHQHHSGATAAVEATLRRLGLVSLALVAAGLAGVLAVGPGRLLTIFGPNYADLALTLLLLCIGTGFTALAGPSPAILTLTGHEGVYSAVMGVGVVLRLASLFAGALAYGPTGAAAASAAVAILQALALRTACQRLSGLDPSVAILVPGRSRPASQSP